MSAVGVAKVLWSGQTGRMDSSVREWTIVRLVEVDSLYDDAPVVCFAPGVGFLGQSYAVPGGSSDPGALLNEIIPARVNDGDETRKLWTVTERYTTQRDEDKNEQVNEDGEPEEDPEKWRDELEIDYRYEKKAVNKAINWVDIGIFRNKGTEGPIVNSANVVQEGYERDLEIMVLRITKRRKKYPADQEWATKTTCNSDDFTISKPKQGLVLPIKKYEAMMPPLRGSLFYMPDKNGKPKPWWKVTHEVHIEKEFGWRIEVLDKGLHRRTQPGDPDGRGGTFSLEHMVEGVPMVDRIVDKKGVPVTEEVLLDGNGQPLGPNQPPVYLPYSVLKEIPYQPLKL